MRRLRYQVAMSLDGFIAGPNGEIDWIAGGEGFDFGAHFAQFDTLLMGRRTWDQLPGGGTSAFGDQRVIVVSRTLDPADHPDIEVITDGVEERVRALKEEPGRDIWLFGGGHLFRSLLDAGCVDTVEPAVVAVLLGEGIPLMPGPQARHRLVLRRQQSYGPEMQLLEYDVVPKKQSGGRRSGRAAAQSSGP